MEKSIHLAIASVPFQKWNEIYGEEEAFEKGTIFPELDKPIFFVEQDQKQMTEHVKKSRAASQEREMLGTIQQTSFVLDDLRLYLDTHPDDMQALKCFKTALKRRKALLREFALAHYPLTMDCIADIYEENPDSECYCWKEGPIPWEGVCK